MSEMKVNGLKAEIITRVSFDLHREFKVYCAQNDTTMNKVLSDLLEKFLASKRKK